MNLSARLIGASIMLMTAFMPWMVFKAIPFAEAATVAAGAERAAVGTAVIGGGLGPRWCFQACRRRQRRRRWWRRPASWRRRELGLRMGARQAAEMVALVRAVRALGRVAVAPAAGERRQAVWQRWVRWPRRKVVMPRSVRLKLVSVSPRAPCRPPQLGADRRGDRLVLRLGRLLVVAVCQAVAVVRVAAGAHSRRRPLAARPTLGSSLSRIVSDTPPPCPGISVGEYSR